MMGGGGQTDESLRKQGEQGHPSIIKYPLGISFLLDTLPRVSDPLPSGSLMATPECTIIVLILEMRKLKLCETFARLFLHASSS